MIEEALKTKSHTVIFPVQDILGLDDKARFNVPGTIENNWQWRFKNTKELSQAFKKLGELTQKWKRGPNA